MKKLGGYIMLFLILANLFAPLSLQKNSQGNHRIKTNVAFAEDKTDVEIMDNCKKSGVQYCMSIRPTSASSSINTAVVLRINIYTTARWAANENLSMHVSMKEKNSGVSVLDEKILDSQMEKVNNPYATSSDFNHYTSQIKTNKGLSPDTEYSASVDSMSIIKISPTTGLALAETAILSSMFIFYFIPGANLLVAGAIAGVALYQVYKAYTDPETHTDKINIELKTPVAAKEGEGPNVTVGDKTYKGSTSDNIMPGCSLAPEIIDKATGVKGTFMGCIAQLTYYAIFVPTSFFFAISGKFFDWTMHYSIQDSSYRVAFVTEGWKIVRDLCNIFFIFLLLSAAVKMILNIGHGAKDMIVNIVIVGLLINFSLFTTQIVIDASNILTRLFYNSNALNIIVKNGQNPSGNGNVSSYVYGQNGQLPISAALVDKVDPQSIIIEAKRINIQSVENDKITNPNAEQMEKANQGIGVGAFFLVVFLAIIINCIGIFVFISVGLIFVGRVVGLWFSMIFVPIAFFSYAAPNLPDGLKRFGFKGWWAELIGTAMLAPVFMFMMYLIILFLSKGFVGLLDPDAHGAEFVLQTTIPFIIIMILLVQAKSVASDMSKGVASSVTTGLKVLGGGALMLGGAGVGLAGRSIIGKMAAKASAGTTATQEYDVAKRALAKNDDSLMRAYNEKYKNNFVKKNLGKLGSNMGFKVRGREVSLVRALGKQGITQGTNAAGELVTNVFKPKTGIGATVNKAQKSVGGIVHANHEYEEIAKALHIDPKIPYKDLGAKDKADVDKKFRDSKRSDTENNIKKGLVAGVQGENEYKASNFDRAKAEFVETKYRNEKGLATTDVLNATQRAELDDKQRAAITTGDKNAINTQLTNQYKETVLKHETDHKLDHDLGHMAENSAKTISFKDRLAADSTRGTYNPLNLSKLDSIKNDAFATRLIFGITSAVALGMRTGMKNIPQVNMGTGSREFKDDLKNTFTEAMKGLSFKLEAPGGGGGHGGGHDDHGGGHDDHGHGGH